MMKPTLLNVPSQLETDRLSLKPYQTGDGQWLHRVYQQNQTHLGDGILAGLGLDMTKPDDAEAFVRQMAADWIMRRRFIFSCWAKENGRYVGELWIECKSWQTGQHDIGYFVISDYLRQGFATEAAKAGLAFVFDNLQAYKAGLTCDEDNIASYKVAERCGFVREGLLRDEKIRADGKRVGTLYYGMLRAEYEKGRL